MTVIPPGFQILFIRTGSSLQRGATILAKPHGLKYNTKVVSAEKREED